ncbi:MAG TPA: PHB depolymerase family esterase [Actinophytocola sp.]|uniref:extracellular catalytic domain type 1 short-chain-length polyhydroxyalkanoate depolymerase n=1 Tax=Actinophytocola sp. TaxID=1872138 RepID=UPI002DBA8B36|nr:PHB depolymerase family esterase [Actinophytocola sp.]HEU5472590.1 PHB depolymerase family esterase [Actinophytocola sp.]
MRRFLSGLISLLLAVTLLTPGRASAAGLVQVTDFGYNPTNLEMHLYVPDNLPRRPAVVVALHFCTGSGPVFHSGTPFASLADQFGFIVIYPSATRASHCFDVSSPEALRHNGNSDPAGIVSMVKYVQRRHHADPGRVFATGLSSGAMMTNVLLGDYPDIFRAGAAFAGVPFGCFATTNGSEWNSECANGLVSKTPKEWGDLVRGAAPGYRGPRPRMQLWHGTEDDILHYPNFGEEIKQWTNVHGLSQTPTATDSPEPTWTRTRYADRSGRVAVEAISLEGAPHNLPLFIPNNLAAYAIQFFGLSDGVALHRLAERTGRFYGTAIVLEELGSNRPYTEVAETQFNMVTPGNAMKWETTEPEPGVFNFAPGDQVVAFARENRDRVRGHTLVWHSQLPAWVGALPAAQVRPAMLRHIRAEASHYAGQLDAWDVVNEPFNEDGTFRQTPFYNAMGTSYIADALRAARAADRKAKLYLNDFNIEGINAKSDAMYALARSLKRQHVPLDGIGIQGHLILGQVPSSMRENIARFAALGLDVAITELDIRMNLPVTDAKLAQQADDYGAVVSACLAVRRCVGVTQWGVGDRDSWIPPFFPGEGAALPFDQSYLPKPAYAAIARAFERAAHPW